MKKSIATSLSIISLLMASSSYATTVQTCTLDYTGSMSAIDVENGVVRGIAKMFAKSSIDSAFTLAAKDGSDYHRHGTITTTIDLSQFVADGQSCNMPNRFTPIHSVSESRPWRQFQMRFDSFYDSNIMARYNHGGINTKLMVANGWTWGTDIATIHVFELSGGEFTPVKFDVDQGNGELPPYLAGDTTMSTKGDGALWQYRASAVSDDGRLVAGYAKLDESVSFSGGASISSDEKFGMVWEIANSCDVDSSKCNNADASRLTSGSENSSGIQVRSLSATQISRNTGQTANEADGNVTTVETSDLRQGQVLSHSSLPENFTIGYRFLSGQDQVTCTLMDAEGALTVENKRERVIPYVIFGDSNNGTVYHTRNKSIVNGGDLTLTINVYPEYDCSGDVIYTDTITVNINTADNNGSAGTATQQNGPITGEFYLVNQETTNTLANFEMLNFDANSTMEAVYGITTIESGKYLVNGRSASGKPMVALVTL